MKRRDLGLLLAAIGSAFVALVLLRRRETLAEVVPEFIEERIVLPMSSLVSDNLGGQSETTTGTADDQERLTRKVGRNRKISVYGKLYGPLEPELIGQQVEVEEREGRFIVWAAGAEVGDFERQS